MMDPKTETPKTETPKTETPKTEEPKTEEPKTEEPRYIHLPRYMCRIKIPGEPDTPPPFPTFYHIPVPMISSYLHCIYTDIKIPKNLETDETDKIESAK